MVEHDWIARVLGWMASLNTDTPICRILMTCAGQVHLLILGVKLAPCELLLFLETIALLYLVGTELL